MDRIDEPHPGAPLAEDDRLCAGAAREVPDTAQQVAVRDPGADHHHVAADEVVDAEDPRDVPDADLLRAPDLGARQRPQLRLDLTTEALQRRGRDDALRRAADADRE